nr:beta-ketoacyl synthase N-terminal-like domain-containing protein [Salinispora arenicola]
MHDSIIANRVSYVLGLQGPSMRSTPACSSSLSRFISRVSRCGRAKASSPSPAASPSISLGHTTWP